MLLSRSLLFLTCAFAFAAASSGQNLAISLPSNANNSPDSGYSSTVVFSGSGNLTGLLAIAPAWLSFQNVGAQITTVAGTGVLGYTGDNGLGTSAELGVPAGLCIDTSGFIYWVEEFNLVIRKQSIQTGIISTHAGTGNFGYTGDGGPAILADVVPTAGIAFDVTTNSIVYCSSANNCIRRIAADGTISTIVGNGQAQLLGDSTSISTAQINPYDLVIDTVGNILFSDHFNKRIRKVDFASGTVVTLAGTGSNSVSGDGGQAILADIGTPFGIGLTPNAHVIFTAQNRIRHIDNQSGVISTLVGTGIAGYNGNNLSFSTTQLFGAGFFAVDNYGQVVYSDVANHLVRSMSFQDSTVQNIGGMPQIQGFAGDGSFALLGQLSNPEGIAVGNGNDIWFSDVGNHRIRKISGPSWTLTGTPTCADIGPHPVTIGVTDGIDTVYQSFTITVQDTVPPALTCPASQTVYVTDTLCGAIVQWTPPTGTDDCSSIAAITTLQTDSIGQGPNNYFGPGIHYIEYTTTDSSGNSNTCSFNITVLDTIAPTALCPSDTTVQVTNASCEAAVTFSAATAADLCGSATLTQTDVTGLTSGDDFPLGTTTLEYTATDASGNTAQCTLNITVADSIPPTIGCEDTITSTQQIVTWPVPQVTDNCFGPALLQTAGPTSGSTFDYGATTVEYTATDVAGNETVCTMIILVDTNTSVPELSLAQKIYAYPNPTSGLLTVELNAPQLLNKQLIVLNSMGQPILQERTHAPSIQLDLSGAAKGVYVLQIETASGPVHKKLIVQ